MGEPISVLLKALSLMYRKMELKTMDASVEELVFGIIDSITVKRSFNYVQDDKSVVESMKLMVSECLTNYTESGILLVKDSIIHDVSYIMGEDNHYLKVFIESLKDMEHDTAVKYSNRDTYTLRKYLRDYGIKKVADVIYKKTNDSINNGGMTDVDISKLIKDLERYKIKTNDDGGNNSLEPAGGAMAVLDLDNPNNTNNIYAKALEDATDVGKLRTGWKGFNKIMGGGFKRGSTIVFVAMEHHNKSGMVRSLAIQMAMYNKPKMKDDTKRPLIVYFSFEDDIKDIMLWYFKYLFYSENRRQPTRNEMFELDWNKYIKDRAERNGYKFIIIRDDPSKWRYEKMQDYIQGLENQGYETHALVMDYLEKVPRSDMDAPGHDGNKMRMILRRMKNLCEIKNITFITPHQMASSAKELKRNQISDIDFLPQIVGKGYTSESAQLSQEPDTMFYLNKARIDNKWHMMVHLDRYRGSEIVDDGLKYFGLPFPPYMPIYPDEDTDEDITYYPNSTQNGDDMGLGL